MMDGTDKHLRDSLDSIMRGEWDSHFTKEQLESARKESFLLNHLRHEEGKAIFEYNSIKIKYGFDCDPTDLQLYSGDLEMQINSIIKSDESFQKAYNSFLRDWKIGNIIGDE
jgi:hypothetical protein